MLKGNRIILPFDVLKHILKHWYRAVIIAIIIAIAFAGYVYLNDKKKTNAQAAHDKKAQEYNLEDFTEDELNQAQNAVDAYEVLCKSQNYYDNSYIQKVDPFAVHRTVLYYRIDMNMAKLPENLVGQEGNLAAALRTEYNYYVSRGDLGTDVAEKLGIDPQYITELISVENEGNVGFNVIFYASDLVPDFSDTIKTVLEEHRAELEKDRNAHILTINNEYDSVLRVDDYYNRQKNSVGDLNNQKNTLNSLLNKLSMEQVAYYNAQTGNDFVYINQETGKEDEAYVSIGKSGLIKKSVIGAIIGVALALVIEMFIFMYSKKVVSESDFTATLGMVLIGNDKNEEDRKVAITKIKNICSKENLKNVIIAGTSEELLKKDIINDLKSEMTDVGISVEVISNFVNDSSKVDKVLKNPNVILAEGVGTSIFPKVMEEADFCENYNINLLGVINCLNK